MKFIRVPPPDPTHYRVKEISEWHAFSSIDAGRVRHLLVDKNFSEFDRVRADFRDAECRDNLIEWIKSAVRQEGFNAESNSPVALLDNIVAQIRYDNAGLFLERQVDNAAQDNLAPRVASGNYSVSSTRPGSLSITTRPSPAAEEPGGVFEKLKERAQAAVIEYAGRFVDPQKGKDSSPEKAARALLTGIGPPEEPKFAETQRVEVTVSSVVNSASVDDRFDYISAYLRVPPFPGRKNSRVSLEYEFLKYFQALTWGRPKEDRAHERNVKTDIHRALDRLRVRVESAENKLKTEVAAVELGTLTSAGELGILAGPFEPMEYKRPGLSAKLSATREDKLARELDKRSFWLDRTRSLLRVTQRGIREATVAGSFSIAITLRIPKTRLLEMKIKEPEVKSYRGTLERWGRSFAKVKTAGMENPAAVMRVKGTDNESQTFLCPSECESVGEDNVVRIADDAGRVKVNDNIDVIYVEKDGVKVALRIGPAGQVGRKNLKVTVDVGLTDVEQPLYGAADGLGMVLGTVRVAVPSLWDRFKREPSGIGYTVLDGPDILTLWTHDRLKYTIMGEDLWSDPDLPARLREKERKRVVGILTAEVRQPAYFGNSKDANRFVEAWKAKTLTYKWKPVCSDSKRYWCVISPSGVEVRDDQTAPEGDQIWVGLENDDGFIGPFGEPASK